MTKQELLVDLAKKFHKIGVITEAETNSVGQEIRKQEGIKWELVAVYERNEDVLIRRHISIYTENEGKSDERAFYGEKLLTEKTITAPAPESTFRNEVNQKIKSEIEKTNIIKGSVSVLSEKDNFAIIRAYLKENEEIIVKNLFVYKDIDEKIKLASIKKIQTGESPNF